MIRVVIADDHTLVRAGFISLIQAEPDMEVAAECGTGREALALCRSHAAHVLVLDLEMPGPDGFQIVQMAHDTNLPSKILILTMHDHEEYMLRLFQAGALGYLMKDAAPAVLAEAIRSVAKGKRYIPESSRESLAERLFNASGDDPLYRLTNREMQVITRIAKGLNAAAIAEDLCISPYTVATYKSRAMGKAGLRDSGDIVRFALRNGLIKNYR
jgi:DNA-binding NarL/FixJ family response regulator